MNTLPRSIGAHLGLLSMATSVMFSATPAAFASTGTLNVNLSVTVTEQFTFTVQGFAPAGTGTSGGAQLAEQGFGSISAGSAATPISTKFTVISNNSKGYDVKVDANPGACTKIMCSSADSMPDKSPVYATSATAGSALVQGDGLAFRMQELEYNVLNFARPSAPNGTDASKLWTGIPTAGFATLIDKTGITNAGGDVFRMEFGLHAPSFQATGTYTTTNPIVFTAINKP